MKHLSELAITNLKALLLQNLLSRSSIYTFSISDPILNHYYYEFYISYKDSQDKSERMHNNIDYDSDSSLQ